MLGLQGTSLQGRGRGGAGSVQHVSPSPVSPWVLGEQRPHRPNLRHVSGKSRNER